MQLQIFRSLDQEQRAKAYEMYNECFTKLNKHTIQRHLMTQDEFVALSVDQRVLKYCVYDDANNLVGLSVFSNELDAMPLISPAYFEHHYPQHYAEKRVWYCGFVAVLGHAPHVFSKLVSAMFAKAGETKSIISLDFCKSNDRLPPIVSLMLRRLDPSTTSVHADAQNYWVYEMGAT